MGCKCKDRIWDRGHTIGRVEQSSTRPEQRALIQTDGTTRRAADRTCRALTISSRSCGALRRRIPILRGKQPPILSADRKSARAKHPKQFQPRAVLVPLVAGPSRFLHSHIPCMFRHGLANKERPLRTQFCIRNTTNVPGKLPAICSVFDSCHATRTWAASATTDA